MEEVQREQPTLTSPIRQSHTYQRDPAFDLTPAASDFKPYNLILTCVLGLMPAGQTDSRCRGAEAHAICIFSGEGEWTS